MKTDYDYRRTRKRRTAPPSEAKPVNVIFNICPDCARRMSKPSGPYSLSLINQTANRVVCPFCFREGSRDRYRKN